MARNRPYGALIASSLGLLASVLAKQPSTPAVFRRPRGKRLARMLGRTGKTYPHSSARQQARYARQIAAGQLKMDGV